jgi:hypothetical protein
LKKTWRRLISSLMLLACLVGCLPQPEQFSTPPWQYADLRQLASPGEGPASHQLVGLYTRRFRSQEQIRLDLLDLDFELDYDLYLALDTVPGGKTDLPIQAATDFEWDILLVIPALGPMQAFGPDGVTLEDLHLRIVRNPSLDTVVISLAAARSRDSYSIQVFLTPHNLPDVASSLGPVRSDEWPPARLPVLLAFWNTFPAYTPAQALRRFDGAHTGPASDRHGLRSLLDAIEAARFPAALLDIKNPASLSALDFAGALTRVQDLATRDLLILPDQLPLSVPFDAPFHPHTWVRIQAAENARQVAGAFGLAPSPFLYSAGFPGELVENHIQQVGNYRLVFSLDVPGPDSADTLSHIDPLATAKSITSLSPVLTRWGAYNWVDFSPIVPTLQASIQASYTGPTLEIRRTLLEAVTAPDAGHFVVLGGDLAQTAWGNPQAAMQTMRYLVSRPWIQPVSRDTLAAITAPQTGASDSSPANTTGHSSQKEPFYLNNPLGEPLASNLTAQQVHDLLMHELAAAPENNATQLAWQAYEALLAPAAISTPALAPLRAVYLSQVGHLLAASRWGAAGPGAFCSRTGECDTCLAAIDLDWDGENEYILASSTFFAILEARGAYLSVAFVRSPAGLHQIIAPSTQFMVGIGDPLSWNPGKGIAGDAYQFRGAFSDLTAGFAFPSWEIYSVAMEGQSLVFTAPDGNLRKTFRLARSGMQVDYASSQPLTVQIPVAIEPEARFRSDWGSRYQGDLFPDGWTYGLVDGPQVHILTSETLTARPFSDSLSFMGQPENPDFDYPPGHFLPFPLALAEIHAQGEFSIQLDVIARVQ